MGKLTLLQILRAERLFHECPWRGWRRKHFFI